MLLESLSAGTPAIATKVGGIPEIINDRNGVLISTNEDELYEAMKKILLKQTEFDHPKKLHQYVEDHFSIKTIGEKFDKIYREVLN